MGAVIHGRTEVQVACEYFHSKDTILEGNGPGGNKQSSLFAVGNTMNSFSYVALTERKGNNGVLKYIRKSLFLSKRAI